MDTNYDQIAEQYKRSKLQPWRTHIERYTLLALAGDVSGQAVIDLACGEGYYTRELRRLGAARVVGVDLSREMIALAQAEEAREPLGIEYRVGDARDVDLPGQFDLVFAAYLLNYAHTAAELAQMCRAVARSLKPGGRFVTINNHPADPPANFATCKPYGFAKRLEGDLVEGAPIVWKFFLPDGAIELTNYYLSEQTMNETFRAAGLRDVRWHAPKVSPEGLREFGSEYWAAFLACPPVAFITATYDGATP
ncbi:MAG TPA: class I SAM-dependent methyltransferase [Pirellulaceae bacterium]|nr:class I SAM-dependent methyltransferase [Pirellulaceae bacterium]